jgi:Domain of unknown function (DUF4203)
MLALLAQATTAAPPDAGAAAVAPGKENLCEIVTAMFSRGDLLAHPEHMLNHLQALSLVWAVIFLTAGLVCLFSGYRYYKTVIVVLALAIGMFSGYYLGLRMDAGTNPTNARYIIGGCLAALFAVVCFPLMKYAVAVLGGLIGAFIGANAWAAIAVQAAHGHETVAAQNYWIGALVGLIIFGMLAFILFKASLVMSTSISGSTLAVMGAMALLLQVPQWRGTVSNSVSSHAVILPMLVLVPAVIGLIHQGVTSPAGKGGGGGKEKAAA